MDWAKLEQLRVELAQRCQGRWTQLATQTEKNKTTTTWPLFLRWNKTLKIGFLLWSCHHWSWINLMEILFSLARSLALWNRDRITWHSSSSSPSPFRCSQSANAPDWTFNGELHYRCKWSISFAESRAARRFQSLSAARLALIGHWKKKFSISLILVVAPLCQPKLSSSIKVLSFSVWFYLFGLPKALGQRSPSSGKGFIAVANSIILGEGSKTNNFSLLWENKKPTVGQDRTEQNKMVSFLLKLLATGLVWVSLA